jgi:hypothetical protein
MVPSPNLVSSSCISSSCLFRSFPCCPLTHFGSATASGVAGWVWLSYSLLKPGYLVSPLLSPPLYVKRQSSSSACTLLQPWLTRWLNPTTPCWRRTLLLSTDCSFMVGLQVF